MWLFQEMFSSVGKPPSMNKGPGGGDGDPGCKTAIMTERLDLAFQTFSNADPVDYLCVFIPIVSPQIFIPPLFMKHQLCAMLAACFPPCPH